MLELDRFTADVCTILKRDIASNPDQYDIVTSPFGRCLKVVAGPGSGKTTVIVLRLLKMIYVDDVKPSEIIATTFTRKAASELKSRILRWGTDLQNHYLHDDRLSESVRHRIERLNFNLITTGTIDSIAEDVLTKYRNPDENPPIVLDDYVTKQIMLNKHFSQSKDELGREFGRLGFTPFDYQRASKKVNLLMNIHLRASENSLDIEKLHDEIPTITQVIKDYRSTMRERRFEDFPSLEARFIHKIENEPDGSFISDIRVLMIDEYQDTNLQQESIYKVLASHIVSSGGSVIVVGDDDQSIYRFRGSRVHLFADMESRFAEIGVWFDTVFLSVNYRSTPSIVDFCNRLALADDDYQDVRVKSKPKMTVGRKDGTDIPILGIFRQTEEELGRDIARMVHEFSVNGSYIFHATDGSDYLFERDQDGGAFDMVLLMNSVRNTKNNGNPRLPIYIEHYLETMTSPISVFNPRGDELYRDECVKVLCGTALKCLDPSGEIVAHITLTPEVRDVIDEWRTEAESFIENAEPVNGYVMSDYVKSWADGRPYPKGGKWSKTEVKLLDMMSNILTWIKELRNDAEFLVYLQSVYDAVKNSALIFNQELTIQFEKGTSKIKSDSVKRIINRIFVPIADGTLDLDEDLFFTVPLKDRFNIMTVHQSKGLEFPITIVDVSSELQDARSKFTRFPTKIDSTSKIEALMRRHSDAIPEDRDLVDLQFDDLIRKYFVAYSRAQDVLILVGSTRTLDAKKPLEHVGLGWDRQGTWKWRGLPDIKMMR